MLITVGFILAILGAIGGILWVHEQIIKRIKNIKIIQLFNISPKEKVIIVAPTQKYSHSDPNIATTFEDSMAQSLIQTKFAELGIPHEIRLHLNIDKRDLPEHLFLICGPVGNSVTKKALSHKNVNLPYKFKKEGDWWIITDQKNRKMHTDVILNELDFAILAKLKNPWALQDHPTFIYICAGIWGLGTWGSTYYLTNRIEDLSKKMKIEGLKNLDGYFCAIVNTTSLVSG